MGAAFSRSARTLRGEPPSAAVQQIFGFERSPRSTGEKKPGIINLFYWSKEGAAQPKEIRQMWFWWPVVAPRMLSLPSLWSFCSPTTYMSVDASGWDYAPSTEWGEGDLSIERRIRAEVATPGRELGIVNDALVAVIRALEQIDAVNSLPDEQREAILRFENMVGMITEIVEKERAKRPGGLREIPRSVNLPTPS
jgi:hypothetical protein